MKKNIFGSKKKEMTTPLKTTRTITSEEEFLTWLDRHPTEQLVDLKEIIQQSFLAFKAHPNSQGISSISMEQEEKNIEKICKKVDEIIERRKK